MSDKKGYVVHWKSGRTGATGHGTGSFPKDEAQDYADRLNDEHRKLNLYFWIKAAPPEATP